MVGINAINANTPKKYASINLLIPYIPSPNLNARCKSECCSDIIMIFNTVSFYIFVIIFFEDNNKTNLIIE